MERKKGKTNRWKFNKKCGRKPLTNDEVKYWSNSLDKLLKVGIELEYNLPKPTGSCRKNNPYCDCVAVFEPKNKMLNTSKCFEQCKNWDSSRDENGNYKYPEDGNCDIAKKHGCAGVMCLEFSKPCTSCSKFDKGCNSCASAYDPNKEPVQIRKRIAGKLMPTKFVGNFGKKGVYQVVKDGSLNHDGGVEVVTVGRRPEFTSLYKMLSEIIDLCKESGAYVDERCSIHVHLLASYLKKDGPAEDLNSMYLSEDLSELEKPVPEIILANFHQLFRRFQNALIWMGSSGESVEHLTRWERFRKPLTPFSALKNKMDTIRYSVAASAYKAKYGIVNYQPLEFNDDGDISTFHIESRYLDGMLSPAVVAAHSILIYGLMLKAVELSKHGTLVAGTPEEMSRKKKVYQNLCNGDGSWGDSRKSDTSGLPPYFEDLREESKELIRLIKSVLHRNSPCDEVLEKLANNPVSLMRYSGMSWEEVEKALVPEKERDTEGLDVLEELIDTSCISGCSSREEWLEEAVKEIAHSTGNYGDERFIDKQKRDVSELLEEFVSKGDITWINKIGTFVRNM